jgi:hypothetical protein
MRPHVVSVVSCAVLALLVPAAQAQIATLGTFNWQLEPYCNVITLTVTQNGSTFMLDGFDTQCGAAHVAPAHGVARVNPDGSVGLGLTIVNTPGGTPTHLDAVINLATLSGTWSDSGGIPGAFTFNGAGGGVPRPLGILRETRVGNAGAFIGARINGTQAAPTAVLNDQVIMFLGGRGHDGNSVGETSEGQIRMLASENWTPTRHGTRIDFLTTENGGVSTNVKMTIDHDGDVGIGTDNPVEELDVMGNIRIGTGIVGCVEDRDGTVLTGVCASDARFKRDITPFRPMLDKVAALRPVQFFWRADEFPARAFGARESYGLVAQDVERVLPELVSTDADGYKAVNYSRLPLVALQAIKELKAAHEARTSALEQRLAELEAELKRLGGR